jgi:hypothetical protein
LAAAAANATSRSLLSATFIPVRTPARRTCTWETCCGTDWTKCGRRVAVKLRGDALKSCVAVPRALATPTTNDRHLAKSSISRCLRLDKALEDNGIQLSGGSRTPMELFLAGLSGWSVEIRRILMGFGAQHTRRPQDAETPSSGLSQARERHVQ